MTFNLTEDRSLLTERCQYGAVTLAEPSVELEEERKAEMSVWGEKSFFRRMARKAPGGWAFTPQPKFGRTVDFVEEAEEIPEDKENVKVSAVI